MQIEKTILKHLLLNEEFTRKVIPYLKDEYFHDDSDKLLFSKIKSFILTYNKRPTKEAVLVEINSQKNVREEVVRESIASVNSFFGSPLEETSQEWLISSTEEFCQEKDLYSAILKSIDIINNKGQLTKGSIPQLLSDALSVTFDPNIGHDYLEQYADRFKYYHLVEKKIPFDLDFFNKITRGGLPDKTLNVIMAGPGVGKSLTMCHMASNCLSQGRNVLYISMELSEEEVAKRIDANLMNITIDDLLALPEAMYNNKAEILKSRTNGKLIVKEYPTASASTIHFKSLLNELKLKKKFIPNIIFVDYLNICSSARIKPGAGVNSYSYIKSIAEELRGLAVEFSVPLVTATQVNRAGSLSTDVGMEDVSESFGLPATADMLFALISTEELEKLNQIMVKQLKNRYNDPSINRRFVIGVDKSKMKLYDVEPSQQQNISESGQQPERKEDNYKDKFRKIKVL